MDVTRTNYFPLGSSLLPGQLLCCLRVHGVSKAQCRIFCSIPQWSAHHDALTAVGGSTQHSTASADADTVPANLLCYPHTDTQPVLMLTLFPVPVCPLLLAHRYMNMGVGSTWSHLTRCTSATLRKSGGSRVPCSLVRFHNPHSTALQLVKPPRLATTVAQSLPSSFIFLLTGCG